MGLGGGGYHIYIYIYVNIHAYIYIYITGQIIIFTNLDFPEIRGFPFLSYLLGEIGRVRSL